MGSVTLAAAVTMVREMMMKMMMMMMEMGRGGEEGGKCQNLRT